MKPRTAPTPVSEVTFLKRLAHRSLLLALEGAGLAPLSILPLNPDDLEQSFIYMTDPAGPVVLFSEYFGNRWDKPLATVVLWPSHAPTHARVTIPRITPLVRFSHRKDFRLERRPGTEGEPDADVVVELADILEQHGDLLRTAPLRPVDPARRRRRAILRSFRALP